MWSVCARILQHYLNTHMSIWDRSHCCRVEFGLDQDRYDFLLAISIQFCFSTSNRHHYNPEDALINVATNTPKITSSIYPHLHLYICTSSVQLTTLHLVHWLHSDVTQWAGHGSRQVSAVIGHSSWSHSESSTLSSGFCPSVFTQLSVRDKERKHDGECKQKTRPQNIQHSVMMSPIASHHPLWPHFQSYDPIWCPIWCWCDFCSVLSLIRLSDRSILMIIEIIIKGRVWWAHRILRVRRPSPQTGCPGVVSVVVLLVFVGFMMHMDQEPASHTCWLHFE